MLPYHSREWVILLCVVRWLLPRFQELRKSSINENILSLSDWLRKWTLCGVFMAHTSYQQNQKSCITRNEVIGNEQENMRTTNLPAALFEAKNDDWGGLISASSSPDSCVHPILSHTHKLVCVWPYTRSGCWELFCNNIHTCNSPMGLGAFGPFGSLVWGSHDINLGGNERCGKGRIRLQELE